MNYVLTRKSPRVGITKLYRNRRKKLWQSYCQKGCVYPTNKGAAKTAFRISGDNIDESIYIEPLDSL